MSQKDLDKIIREYLSGKYSPEGEELFNTWFTASHDDKTSPLEGLTEAEKEKIRQEIFTKVKPYTSIQTQPTRKLSERSGWKLSPRWYRMAAAWAGLLLISMVCLMYLNQNETTTIRTVYGEIKNVTLPDGSEVTLNANSTLRYTADWEEQMSDYRINASRQVWLDGEAFFSVVHTQDDRKFEVHTSQLNVEVLGTEFNVNNRRGDTEVVLHTGKVKLDINQDETVSEIVMKPGELVIFSGIHRSLTKKLVNPQHYSTWRNQELILDNTSLIDIARALEDYYGFEIIIQDDSLKQTKLTATATLSLKDTDVILTAISEIYDINVQQEDNRIIFSKP
ncbi:FecR family protein [Catalinimonas niigatensis]|uniref:FecR family protein n=1 Tax=Catalinimonas niigatensis TaxID=1397264 RepID=UPI0026661364|nr:FecR domain-containing protein [Catalinimonas niigatensis]WPP51914.1 FecR domain-containing protein [Catalinimonas niigatensis]